MRFSIGGWCKRSIPLVASLRGYKLSDCLCDLWSGTTCGLALVPHCLAFSILAGLRPEYGLYSALYSGVIHAVLGSTRGVIIAPTLITSVLLLEAGLDRYRIAVLCFLTSLVQLGAVWCGGTVLLDLLSKPAIAATLCGLTLKVVLLLVPDLLGIQRSGTTAIETVNWLYDKYQETRLWDGTIGIVSLVTCLAFAMLKTTSSLRYVTRLLNNNVGTIVVAMSTAVGYYLVERKEHDLLVVGQLPAGLPDFKPFWLYSIKTTTESGAVQFFDSVKTMNYEVALIPVIGLFEHVMSCKSVAGNRPVSKRWEVLSLGLSNLVSSFFQGFPTAGNVHMSTLAAASGVKTQLSGLFSTCILVLTLLLLTPYLVYVPRACIAGILIAKMLTKIELWIYWSLWKSHKIELVLSIVSFLSCLFLPLQTGFVVVFTVNLLTVLYHVARPKIKVEKYRSPNNIDFLVVTPNRGLLFPSCDHLKSTIIERSDLEDIPVALDCTFVSAIDYTSVSTLQNLAQYFQSVDRPLFVFNLENEVRRIFEKMDLKQIGLYYVREDIDELLKMM